MNYEKSSAASRETKFQAVASTDEPLLEYVLRRLNEIGATISKDMSEVEDRLSAVLGEPMQPSSQNSDSIADNGNFHQRVCNALTVLDIQAERTGRVRQQVQRIY